MNGMPERRPGEKAIELPGDFGAGLVFIGRIRTPWTQRKSCPKNVREAKEIGQTATIIVDSPYDAGLKGIESYSHVWILYWMHQSARNLVEQWPRHVDAPEGTFALRSPARPNPIAIAACELLGRDGNQLTVLGPDCLDGTPLLDIKPYFASTDSIADARKIG